MVERDRTFGRPVAHHLALDVGRHTGLDREPALPIEVLQSRDLGYGGRGSGPTLKRRREPGVPCAGRENPPKATGTRTPGRNVQGTG